PHELARDDALLDLERERDDDAGVTREPEERVVREMHHEVALVHVRVRVEERRRWKVRPGTLLGERVLEDRPRHVRGEARLLPPVGLGAIPRERLLEAR